MTKTDLTTTVLEAIANLPGRRVVLGENGFSAISDRLGLGNLALSNTTVKRAMNRLTFGEAPRLRRWRTEQGQRVYGLC